MKRIIQRAKQMTLVRYLFVGGTAYIFELSSLLALFYVLDSRTLATAISFWIGFLVAFFLQKLLAFRNYQSEVKAITRQGLLYTLLNIWNYLFTVGFVSLFPDEYLVVSRTVALVMMSAWNFIIYKKIIFKRNVKTPV